MKQRHDQWSDEELRTLEEKYSEHGPAWLGWETLLPKRSKRAIATKASDLKLQAPQGRPQGLVKRPVYKKREEPETCGECAFYLELRAYESSDCGVGKCTETHSAHLFGRTPDVLARYKAKGLCPYGVKRQ